MYAKDEGELPALNKAFGRDIQKQNLRGSLGVVGKNMETTI